MVGINQGYVDTFIVGSVPEQKFVMFFIDAKDRVIAACGMQNGGAMMTIKEAIE
jgi:hypothetical protein